MTCTSSTWRSWYKLSCTTTTPWIRSKRVKRRSSRCIVNLHARVTQLSKTQSMRSALCSSTISKMRLRRFRRRDRINWEAFRSRICWSTKLIFRSSISSESSGSSDCGRKRSSWLHLISNSSTFGERAPIMPASIGNASHTTWRESHLNDWQTSYKTWRLMAPATASLSSTSRCLISIIKPIQRSRPPRHLPTITWSLSYKISTRPNQMMQTRIWPWRSSTSPSSAHSCTFWSMPRS